MTVALETRGLCKNFGALAVARSIDFRLETGARHALIGPNGAGKTTLVNLITGRIAPSSGQVFIAGDDVTRLAEAQRVKRGLARTFQITTLFKGLSVLENVTMAVGERENTTANMWRAAGSRRAIVEEAYGLLERLGIAADAMRRVAELPYGRQRLAEIAMALALRPRVLLLDEPAAGVPSTESAVILDVVGALPDDIAVLIIEHDMELVFRFARRITVLVEGAILTEGTPAEIAADSRVREVYLGKSHGADHG
ncbi:MAG: ABC transporter ATP-binding protein [Alphaproteobacteria bacterium]|nr:ABC transporter ATP-binding protein [Alphaproteobacteria bacterium]